MLKNILAVIGAVTVAAVAYVAFSDHVIVKIEPDEEGPEDPEEPEEPEEPDYVSILEDMSHSQMTHQFGHDTLPQESDADSNAKSSETTSKSAK